jgi:hypothetical protein
VGNVVFMMSVSLDGFMEGPNREIDWHRVDDELHWHFNELLAAEREQCADEERGGRGEAPPERTRHAECLKEVRRQAQPTPIGGVRSTTWRRRPIPGERAQWGIR